jgi:hypothetical protein
MTDSTHAGPITALMVTELRTALISSGLFQGINLIFGGFAHSEGFSGGNPGVVGPGG